MEIGEQIDLPFEIEKVNVGDTVMCKIGVNKKVSFVKEGGVITDIPVGSIIEIEPRVINYVSGIVMPKTKGKFIGYKDEKPIFYQIITNYFGKESLTEIPFLLLDGDIFKVLSL